MEQPDVGGLYAVGVERLFGACPEIVLDYVDTGLVHDGRLFHLHFHRPGRFGLVRRFVAGLGNIGHDYRVGDFPGLEI